MPVLCPCCARARPVFQVKAVQAAVVLIQRATRDWLARKHAAAKARKQTKKEKRLQGSRPSRSKPGARKVRPNPSVHDSSVHDSSAHTSAVNRRPHIAPFCRPHACLVPCMLGTMHALYPRPLPEARARGKCGAKKGGEMAAGEFLGDRGWTSHAWRFSGRRFNRSAFYPTPNLL